MKWDWRVDQYASLLKYVLVYFGPPVFVVFGSLAPGPSWLPWVAAAGVTWLYGAIVWTSRESIREYAETKDHKLRVAWYPSVPRERARSGMDGPEWDWFVLDAKAIAITSGIVGTAYLSLLVPWPVSETEIGVFLILWLGVHLYVPLGGEHRKGPHVPPGIWEQ